MATCALHLASEDTPAGRADGSQVRITAPAGADLEAVLRALGQAGPGVVAADRSAVPAVLRAPLEQAALGAALEPVSRDLDRFWIRRGRTLVLQRRFSDPSEDPGLEIEELRRATADLYRLLASLGGATGAVESIRDQKDFARTITDAQEQKMLNGGLPFTDLSPAQQANWLRVNSAKAWGTGLLDIRRAMLCLGQWDRATMQDFSPPPGFHQQFYVLFANPDQAGKQEGCSVMAIPAGNRRPRTRRAEGVTLPASTGKLPASLQPAWDLPLQELDLPGLAAKLREAGGPELTFPDYARGRRFWIGSRGGARGEVLRALEDLWGWELTPRKAGFALGRPQLSAPRDAQDLYRKARRAIPPVLHHLLEAASESANDRVGYQMDRVLQGAEKAAGKDWKRLRVADLDGENQRRLANLIAARQLGQWYLAGGKREQPYLWMTEPQRGVFQLSGPRGPGRHPTLLFLVREDARNNLGWGWAIDTDTLPN